MGEKITLTIENANRLVEIMGHLKPYLLIMNPQDEQDFVKIKSELEAEVDYING